MFDSSSQNCHLSSNNSHIVKEAHQHYNTLYVSEKRRKKKKKTAMSVELILEENNNTLQINGSQDKST